MAPLSEGRKGRWIVSDTSEWLIRYFRALIDISIPAPVNQQTGVGVYLSWAFSQPFGQGVACTN